MTKKELRKALRDLPNFGQILIPGWGQVKKIGKSYAVGPLPEKDDSDIMHDHSAWTYGFKLSWAVDMIARETNLE